MSRGVGGGQRPDPDETKAKKAERKQNVRGVLDGVAGLAVLARDAPNGAGEVVPVQQLHVRHLMIHVFWGGERVERMMNGLDRSQSWLSHPSLYTQTLHHGTPRDTPRDAARTMKESMKRSSRRSRATASCTSKPIMKACRKSAPFWIAPASAVCSDVLSSVVVCGVICWWRD